MIALVTGAGTGIGRAIVERLWREKYSVILVGRRKDVLEKLAQENPKHSLVMPCDLSKTSEIEKMVRELGANREFAKVSVLVNNAGIYEQAELANADTNHWQNIFATNLFGPVELTRRLLPSLVQSRGTIVNISSTLGLHTMAATGAYSASKAAMVNWTQTLAIEYAAKGVRANCVCPGLVDTPIHGKNGLAERKSQLNTIMPLGRVGAPEDIAHAVWSLIAPGSEWMTGTILPIDGGLNLT